MRQLLARRGKAIAEKRTKDYLTTSNDNTQVKYSQAPQKQYNPHLTERGVQGAKSNAIWEKEHPNAVAWGYVAPAIPFAVAAAPAVMAGSNALAGTALVRLGAQLLAKPAVQYINGALTTAMVGHGASEVAHGNFTPMTALELAPLGRLAKPIYNVGKEVLQYATKAIDNATRYASPSYDLYRTIGETPVSKGSLQRTLTEDFGIFTGPKRVTFFDTPYRQTLDDSFNLIKESTEAPKQYGMRFLGKHGDVPEVLGEDGRWHGNVTYYKNRRFSDPIDNSIIVGKESEYQPTNYLFHYDMGNYPIHYNTDGAPMLHRVPNSTGDLGPIWWGENSKWGDRSVVEPRLIKAPDYGKYRQNLVGDNIGDSDAILTGDYPLKDAEFLERDNLLGTMRRGIFAQQPTVKATEAPTIKWRDAVKPPKITSENASKITPEQWTVNRPQVPNGELVVSALPDYKGSEKIDFDLFKRFTDRNNLKETMRNVETTSNNIDITSGISINSDKRFMMFEPGRFINHDIGSMSVDEVVNTFGPEAAYYKKLYDVAKTHNFEGEYAKIGQNAEYNILNRFAINKADPDVAKGIAEARGIYNIPEYRERFNRWGTLGDTFVDDALSRIDNVKLQGLSKEIPIKGQHGVHGGAYTSPDATTIGITNRDSSSWITDMVRHETNHVGHGLKRQPDWMRYHNEKIRPIVREGETTNTPLDKYYDEMDEIVERSKTAIEYANKIRKEGETLDQALTRLADMTEANIYNAEIPADIRQSIARYTKDSMLNFWKNFVGGYAAPIGIGLTGYGLFNNQEALGGKINKRKR